MNDQTPNPITSSTTANETWDETNLYCGEMTDNFMHVWKQFQYWCEGILFTAVGGFGAIGNIISILILTTR